MQKTVNFEANQITNDSEHFLNPYSVEITITGTAPVLFHRWSCEDVEAKATAAKNSKTKKTDNIEAYIYRTEKGNIAIPTEYSAIHMKA